MTFDLFISYKSEDADWAKRLFNDLKRDYPTVQIFFDRTSLGIGESWRDQLRSGAISSRFLVALWSASSKASDEVRWEVAAFEAYTQRSHIPMFLEGAYTPAEEIQGLTVVSKTDAYDATAPDRGTSKLAIAGRFQRDWDADVRKLGDMLMDTQKTTQAILLAIIAMPKSWLPDLQKPGRLAQEIHRSAYYLKEIGLSFEKLQERYGDDAFSWQPFGDGVNVIEMLEDFRVRVNRNLSCPGFHWKPIDLVSKFMELKDESQLTRLLENLSAQPSLVVIDPVSLYHPDIQTVFLRLDKYMQKESSTVVSFSPINRIGVNVLFEALRQRAMPLLEQYFAPDIPPQPGAFAHCGLNLDSIWELERLVRSRLGAIEAQRRLEAAKHITGMGV